MNGDYNNNGFSYGKEIGMKPFAIIAIGAVITVIANPGSIPYIISAVEWKLNEIWKEYIL